VKYFELTNHTQEVLDTIHNFIGEPNYEYDLKNIKQTTWEYDGIYNYKFLHKIREGEIKFKKGDFQLEPKFISAINERFVALNKLVLEGDYSALLNLPPVEIQNTESPESNLVKPAEPEVKKNPFQVS
jgi:hypothetical protein